MIDLLWRYRPSSPGKLPLARTPPRADSRWTPRAPEVAGLRPPLTGPRTWGPPTRPRGTTPRPRPAWPNNTTPNRYPIWYLLNSYSINLSYTILFHFFLFFFFLRFFDYSYFFCSFHLFTASSFIRFELFFFFFFFFFFLNKKN